MIAYLDSSFLVRALLADEAGHDEASAALDDANLARVTGSWTRIEVTGAVVRAGRAGRCDTDQVLSLLDDDLEVTGRVSQVAAPQEEVEDLAYSYVRAHGLRAMDAWHLATAQLVLPELSESGDRLAFATRDDVQAAVAEALGFVRL